MHFCHWYSASSCNILLEGQVMETSWKWDTKAMNTGMVHKGWKCSWWLEALAVILFFIIQYLKVSSSELVNRWWNFWSVKLKNCKVKFYEMASQVNTKYLAYCWESVKVINIQSGVILKNAVKVLMLHVEH